LPWRETKDPYKIWLSEVMLQQTQVSTVIPYYHKWIKQYPTIESVADAHIDSLLKTWEGLGYYSRCRNFHEAAKIVNNNYGGMIPSDKKLFQSLPGVGDYILGAVLSIAFDRPYCAIDGNHRRVLYRLLGLKKRSKKNESRIANLLKAQIEIGRPGDINQALMDIGSAICKPKTASCNRCPLKNSCRASKMVNPLSYPAPKLKKVIPTKEMAAILITKNDKIYISKRSNNGLLGGLWELPNVQLNSNSGDHIEIKKKVHKTYGQHISVRKNLGKVTHAFTHFKMNITLFGCVMIHSEQDNHNGKWISYSALTDYAFSKANHKLFKLIDKENV